MVATGLLCTAVIFAVANTTPAAGKAESRASLRHEQNAVSGAPEAPDRESYYGMMELPIENGCCKFGIAAAPKLNGDQLELYFTSAAENTVGLKIVLCDAEDNIVGESGILKKGEYVQSVTLADGQAGTQLNAKILTYEEETYYSLGSARAMLIVR